MRYNPPWGMTDPEPTFGSEPFINGNPATGAMGSIPPAASIEFPQREIVAVIQYAHDKGLLDYNNTACAVPSNSDLQQLLKAIFGMTNQRKLQSDMTIYINSSTGDDTIGDGTLAKPYRTYQTAVNNAQSRFDLNLKHAITFHGTGNFTQTCNVTGLFAGQAGPFSVIFDNTAATFNMVNSDCFNFFGAAQAFLIGGTYSASSDGVTTNTGVGIQVGGGSIVYHRGGYFSACDVAHWFIYGQVGIVGTYTINGNAACHVVMEPQSVFSPSNGPFTINLVGTPNFSSAFASVYGGSYGACSGGATGVTFSGSATGKKFAISGFGTIYTGFLGASAIPGNIAGTIAVNTGNGELV
jgi:hypothetical protein